MAHDPYRKRDPRNDLLNHQRIKSRDSGKILSRPQDGFPLQASRPEDNRSPGREPVVAPVGPLTEATGRKLALLAYAQLLGNGDHPVTSIATTFNGVSVGVTPGYQKFWTNSLGRPVAMKIAMDVGTSTGAVVKISLGNEESNQNKIDELYASGLVNSAWILVPDNMTIWVASGDTAITWDPITLRGLLFDPVSIFGDDLLP